MDVLRSARVDTAWVGSDNDTTAQIRWYKCAEGAKAFPHFHAFGSPVWEPHPDDWTEGPGIETEPVRWAPSVIDATPGQEFHGKQEWYEKGIPRAVLDDPSPHAQPPCIVPVVEVRGGLRAGGSASEMVTAGMKVGGFAFQIFGL